jgi:uncharacterized membrane protein YphA (DoxX/SURF4 family)
MIKQVAVDCQAQRSYYGSNKQVTTMHTLLHKLLQKPQQLTPLLLRAGLAIIFLYAAISSFANPEDWAGYLPGMLTERVSADGLLKIFSVYELLLAAWLVSGVYTRYAALLCAATLGGIVVSNFELFAITFRDIALIFAALALAAATWNEDKQSD